MQVCTSLSLLEMCFGPSVRYIFHFSKWAQITSFKEVGSQYPEFMGVQVQPLHFYKVSLRFFIADPCVIRCHLMSAEIWSMSALCTLSAVTGRKYLGINSQRSQRRRSSFIFDFLHGFHKTRLYIIKWCTLLGDFIQIHFGWIKWPEVWFHIHTQRHTHTHFIFNHFSSVLLTF